MWNLKIDLCGKIKSVTSQEIIVDAELALELAGSQIRWKEVDNDKVETTGIRHSDRLYRALAKIPAFNNG